MKFYVAGKTQAYEEVNLVQAAVVQTGHRITYDWTEAIKHHGGDVNEVAISTELRRKYALRDKMGIYFADIFIAIGHPHLTGALWECGMAAAWDKPIWLYRWDQARPAVFEDLDVVRKMLTSEMLVDNLWAISSKKRPT